MKRELRFLAGQYIDFLLKGRKEAQLLDRQSAAARRRHRARAPRAPHAGGAFTDQVFGALKVRDLLRFEARSERFSCARSRTSRS